MNGSLDLEDTVRRAGRAWERARSYAGTGVRVELYARTARRLRVGRTASGAHVIDHGLDRGLAVRVFDPDRGALGFAAASGDGPEVAAWAARTAGREALPFDGSAPWAVVTGERREHLGGDAPLPVEEELAGWLDAALARSPAAPTEDPWVEASIAVEVAWSDDGVWIRSGPRAWGIAVATCVDHVDAGSVPRAVAARTVAALPTDPWPIRAGDGDPAGALPPLGEVGSVVFDGDAVGVLVPALVQALSAGRRHGPFPVGPGWIVDDDPLHPEAVVTGAWDDAGFPTRRLRIADGKTVVSRVSGPGSLRRGSFRDPPEPVPAFLVVDPPAVDAPRDSLRVYATRIEALDGGWILDLDGIRSIGGARTEAFGGAVLRISPEELACRCVGGVGGSRQRNGVALTPALRFDGLRVEG